MGPGAFWPLGGGESRERRVGRHNFYFFLPQFYFFLEAPKKSLESAQQFFFFCVTPPGKSFLSPPVGNFLALMLGIPGGLFWGGLFSLKDPPFWRVGGGGPGPPPRGSQKKLKKRQKSDPGGESPYNIGTEKCLRFGGPKKGSKNVKKSAQKRPPKKAPKKAQKSDIFSSPPAPP